MNLDGNMEAGGYYDEQHSWFLDNEYIRSSPYGSENNQIDPQSGHTDPASGEAYKDPCAEGQNTIQSCFMRTGEKINMVNPPAHTTILPKRGMNCHMATHDLANKSMIDLVTQTGLIAENAVKNVERHLCFHIPGTYLKDVVE